MSGGFTGKVVKPFERQSKKFVEHRACEKCGSKDNLAVWWNEDLKAETTWCYTCHEGIRDVDIARGAMTIPHGPLPPEKFLAEGWTQEVVEEYHIAYDPADVWYFQYANPNGVLMAAKGRDYRIPKSEDFHFFWFVKNEDNLLYGMDTRKEGDKLLIVEGEGDAPSAKAMLGQGWCVCSIPDGANESKRNDVVDKSIKKWYEWIDQNFEDIYICFDNDQVGIQYANKNAEFIGFKSRVVLLPKYQTKSGSTKDARDFSRNRLVSEFRDAVLRTPRRQPSFIVTRDARIGRLRKLLLNDVSYTGVSTGLPEVDEILGGLRPSEVSVLFADPGMGKSSFGRYLMTHLVTEHHYKCLYITLEEDQAIADARLIESINHIKLICKDSGINVDDIPRLVDTISDIIMTNYTGDISLKQLMDSIKYAAKIEDVKFVLFDHITAATDSAGEKQHIAIRQMLNALNTAALQNEIHIMVISHTKRAVEQMLGRSNYFSQESNIPKNPTIRDAYGSSAVEQYAHLILSLVRGIDSSHLWVLKNRLTGQRGCVALTYSGGVFKDGTSKGQAGDSKRGRNALQPRNGTPQKIQFSGEDREQISGISTSEENTHEEPDNSGSLLSGPEGVAGSSNVAAGLSGHEARPQDDNRGQRDDDGRLPAQSGSVPGAIPKSRIYFAAGLSAAKPPHPSGKTPDLRGMGDIESDTVDEL